MISGQKDPATFVELSMVVAPTDSETAEAVLMDLGALGTAIEQRPGDAAGTRVTVVGYYYDEAGCPEFDALRRAFARLRPPGGPPQDDAYPPLRRRVRRWRAWAAEARAAFTPFRATAGLTLAPPWDVPAGPERDLLVINPADAFGLGSHPTTRGCLDLIRPPDGGREPAALDVGTGTGILALRAAQCGWHPVIACDNDPRAVAAAAVNRGHNHLPAGIHLYVGELGALSGEGRFGLILANLFLNPLLDLAAGFARRLAPGGELIASGFEVGDEPELVAALEHRGLAPAGRRADHTWCAARFVRA